jgi:hypothetical protein
MLPDLINRAAGGVLARQQEAREGLAKNPIFTAVPHLRHKMIFCTEL